MFRAGQNGAMEMPLINVPLGGLKSREQMDPLPARPPL
jgi:hypothetical protein